jgi:general stress protein YciG
MRDTAKTIRAKYGDDYYHKLGKVGGKYKGKKGFAGMSKEKHQQASKKGGQSSPKIKE